jgi:hypothetical protein
MDSRVNYPLTYQVQVFQLIFAGVAMLRLAIAAVLVGSLPANAGELSPWFGSEEILAFQVELVLSSPQDKTALPVTTSTQDCRGVCVTPPKFAIVGEQDLAKAP